MDGRLSLPRARVQSLIGKLRSHKPFSMAKKKKKKERETKIRRKTFSYLPSSPETERPSLLLTSADLPSQQLRE